MSFLSAWGATLNWAKTLGDRLYLYRRGVGQSLPDMDIPQHTNSEYIEPQFLELKVKLSVIFTTYDHNFYR